MSPRSKRPVHRRRRRRLTVAALAGVGALTIVLEVDWEVMLRWWVGSPGRKVKVDGKDAVVLSLGGGGGIESNLVGWRDGPATLLVIGSGVGTGTLLDIAGSLRPASEEEWSRLPVPGGGGVPTPVPTPTPTG